VSWWGMRWGPWASSGRLVDRSVKHHLCGVCSMYRIAYNDRHQKRVALHDPSVQIFHACLSLYSALHTLTVITKSKLSSWA
jgi:hypothetical protein